VEAAGPRALVKNKAGHSNQGERTMSLDYTNDGELGKKLIDDVLEVYPEKAAKKRKKHLGTIEADGEGNSSCGVLLVPASQLLHRQHRRGHLRDHAVHLRLPGA
jgi:hypothetical protein